MCVFALIATQFLNWFEYRHLAQVGIKAVGRVTAKEPENHNFVRYTFQVNGKSYDGIGSAGGENPEFEELRIGTNVNIYYDPENPDFSFLGNPHKQAASATAGVIFTSLIGSLLSMLGLYVKGWLPMNGTLRARL